MTKKTKQRDPSGRLTDRDIKQGSGRKTDRDRKKPKPKRRSK
jgi:hypothetical protein